MEIEKIIATLHSYERKVLPILKETRRFEEIAKKTGLQKVEVMRALQWLQNKKLVRINKELKEQIILDENGIKYKKNGLPEIKFLKSIAGGHTSLKLIQSQLNLGKQEIDICLGSLRSKGAIQIKKNGELTVEKTEIGEQLSGKTFSEEIFLQKNFPIYASDLNNEEKLVYDNLKKRHKILKINIAKIIDASPTELGKKIIEYGIQEEKTIDRLTPEIIKTGLWKSRKLRSYDVKINVPNISGGRLHFVTQAIQYIKRIWLDMGFREMTGSLVQTSFWDLDALFVPQDHPARDMQDTFYIKDPRHGKLPKDLVMKVKAAHENGFATGSKGWRYKWSEEIAKENLLRTHNTILSAQAIAKLKKEDLPAKFFAVGKVFRNETLSWKSLFEFIQVEGIVVDPNANFKHLKGYLKEFFAKMGFPDVRVRPGHFPYTENSAECDVWHPIKKQWVEVGGSGIFRPEMVKPLLGFECPVLAWGLGMERTIMEYYNIHDIRDIYSNDLKKLREMKIWIK